ncbi:hypothetical protein CCZ01_07880 [Helicobacter monodelphidis]|uniref:single-stranded DNA-binding protein n=1 Tax=Helicobacter sp. 15-1451 TaxID=2004995 RepID=UPI000DCDA99C|nr:single-stranded DNA-binding protein [Helicobacter sp. 15-1451]RAX56963.1 hypothetical protein CCZ01_07880 [Helicobacter sp. 15-1451]
MFEINGIARITHNLELKTLPSGKSMLNLQLASNKKRKDDNGNSIEEACFLECTAFGAHADTIFHYLKKGSPIFVRGELKLEQWNDIEGQKRQKHKMILSSFEFVPKTTEAQSDKKEVQKHQVPNVRIEYDEEDIPF